VNNNELEFELLGHKVKFNPSEDEGIDPKVVVEEVQKEILKMTNSSYKLDPAKVAILVALKMTFEKCKLEAEYKGNIKKLQASATDALRLIEEVTPSTL